MFTTAQDCLSVEPVGATSVGAIVMTALGPIGRPQGLCLVT